MIRTLRILKLQSAVVSVVFEQQVSQAHHEDGFLALAEFEVLGVDTTSAKSAMITVLLLR